MILEILFYFKFESTPVRTWRTCSYATDWYFPKLWRLNENSTKQKDCPKGDIEMSTFEE